MKRLLYLIMGVVFCFVGMGVHAQEVPLQNVADSVSEKTVHRILFVSSYSLQNVSTRNFLSGFLKELNQSSLLVQIKFEHLGDAMKDSATAERMRKAIQHTIDSESIDCLVLYRNEACGWVLDKKVDPRNVPCFFVGYENFDHKDLTQVLNATFFLLPELLYQNIALGMKLNPKVSLIGIGTGETDYPPKKKREIEKHMRQYYPNVQLQYFSMQMGEFKKASGLLKNIPKESFVIIDENIYESENIMNQFLFTCSLNEDYNGMLLVTRYGQFEMGVTGGVMLSSYDMGSESALFLLRSFTGKTGRFMTTVNYFSPHTYMDAEVLKLLGLDYSKLSQDVQYRNLTVPFFMRYLIPILIGFIVFVGGVIALIVFVLKMLRSERRLRSAFRMLPIRYAVFDEGGNILHLEGENENNFQVMQNITSFPRPAYALFRDAINIVLKTNKIANFDYTSFGHRRRLTMYRLQEESSGGTACVGTFSMNVDELYESNQKNERIRQEFQMIFEALNDAILVLDSEGKITLANERACQLAQVESGALTSQQFKDHFPLQTTDDVPFERRIQFVLKHGDVFVFQAQDTSLKIKDKVFQVECAILRITNASGTQSIVVVIHDYTELNARTNELFRQNKLLQTAATLGQMSYFGMDIHGRLVSDTMDNQMIHMWPDGEYPANLLESWVCKEDAPRLRESWEAISRGNIEEFSMNYAADPKDPHYYHIFLRRTYNENNVFTGFLGIIQNVTDSYQRELSYKENYFLLNDLMNTLPTLVFVKNVNNGFTYELVNRNFFNFYDIDEKSVIGKTDFDFSTEAEATLVHQEDVSVEQSEHLLVSQREMIDLKGKKHIFDFYKNVIRLENGHRLLVGMGMDVTEKVRFEQGWRMNIEFQEKFNNILYNALKNEDPLPLIQSVLDDVANEKENTYCYIYQLNSERSVLSLWMSCTQRPPQIKVELSAENLAIWLKYMSTENPIFWNANDSDSLTDIPGVREKALSMGVKALMFHPLFVDNKLWGVVGISRRDEPQCFDESVQGQIRSIARVLEVYLKYNEHHELLSKRQSDLEVALQAASSANRAKSTFLANVSHELRTPLNVILGYISLLYKTDIAEKVHREYLDAVDFSARTLLMLINDILDFSQIEANQMKIVPLPTDFKRMMSNIEQFFYPLSSAKKIGLKLTLQPTIPVLTVDEMRLRQVVVNLISNAVKFTEKGHVDIDVKFMPDDSRLGTLEIVVADTGIGVSKASLEKLFKPFFQEKRVSLSSGQGTGLGLSIVDQLVRLMGGTISVESELNKGSVFMLRLPEVPYSFDAINMPHTDVHKIVEHQDLSHLKVLLVDDIKMNLKMLSALLKLTGMQIDCAESGAEALGKLVRDSYDYVLTDLWMPEMSGEDLARRIRENPEWDHIHIVAVSADVAAKNNFDISIFDDVLEKPIQQNRLFALFNNSSATT